MPGTGLRQRRRKVSKTSVNNLYLVSVILNITAKTIPNSKGRHYSKSLCVCVLKSSLRVTNINFNKSCLWKQNPSSCQPRTFFPGSGYRCLSTGKGQLNWHSSYDVVALFDSTGSWRSSCMRGHRGIRCVRVDKKNVFSPFPSG